MAHIPADDLDGEIGQTSVDGLRNVENVFWDNEPFVVETAIKPSIIQPRYLAITLEDGICQAESSRFDIVWYQSNAYYFHYTDDTDLNWRFDRHPKESAPNKHFHPPPAADSSRVEESCIKVEYPQLVAMAVWMQFRAAYEANDIGVLNEATNPP